MGVTIWRVRGVFEDRRLVQTRADHHDDDRDEGQHDEAADQGLVVGFHPASVTPVGRRIPSSRRDGGRH